MNLDFNGPQPVLSVRASFAVSGNDRPHPDLPLEKGQRLQASLYTVVRRANPVADAWWFRGSGRELAGGNLSPPKGAGRSGKYLKIKRLPPRPSIPNAGEGEKPNCATTPASHWLLHLPLIQIE